mgnify:CR=1 FL=1
MRKKIVQLELCKVDLGEGGGNLPEQQQSSWYLHLWRFTVQLCAQKLSTTNCVIYLFLSPYPEEACCGTPSHHLDLSPRRTVSTLHQ